MRCPYCGSHGPFTTLKNDHMVCKKCGYKFNIWDDPDLQEKEHVPKDGK